MKKIITIEGMHCNHCSTRVENALKEISGIKNVKVNLEKKTATVNLKDEVSDEILFNKVKDLGFEPLNIKIKKGLLG